MEKTENIQKRKVILVTDGDRCAREALERAVINIGGRVISKSGGNPTPISSDEIIRHVKNAESDPVVVMVDDKGHIGMGKGEQVMYEIINHPDIQVLGVVAVASNTKGVRGVKVDYSVDNNGDIINAPVDKHGRPSKRKVLYGDTVDILNQCAVPIIVGIGDIGKMKGHDEKEIGAPVVTKALELIMNKNNIAYNYNKVYTSSMVDREDKKESLAKKTIEKNEEGYRP